MTDDVRKSKRAPISLKIRFKSATVDEFIEQYCGDISGGGIFIKSQDPLPAGTLIKFEFRLKDNSPLIQGVGRVVWRRPVEEAEGAGLPPGMGIKFIKMDEMSRAVIDQAVKSKAPSGDDDNDGPPLGREPSPPRAVVAAASAAQRQPEIDPNDARSTVPGTLALHDALSKAINKGRQPTDEDEEEGEHEEEHAGEAQPNVPPEESGDESAVPGDDETRADDQEPADDDTEADGEEQGEEEPEPDEEDEAPEAEEPPASKRPSRPTPAPSPTTEPESSTSIAVDEPPKTGMGWSWIVATALVLGGAWYVFGRGGPEELPPTDDPTGAFGQDASTGLSPNGRSGDETEIAPEEEVVHQFMITTVPSGATVTIDGTEQEGTSPLELSGLTLDQPITIGARLTGYLPAEQQATPTVDTQTVELQLEPLPRRVRLSTDVRAYYFIDGKRIGARRRHTLNKVSLPLTVRFEAARHKTVEITIDENTGQWQEVDDVYELVHEEVSLPVSEQPPPRKARKRSAAKATPAKTEPTKRAPAEPTKSAPDSEPETPRHTKAPADEPETPPTKAPSAPAEEEPPTPAPPPSNSVDDNPYK
jgi:uncharacterized protein (TIGR02266 family)